MGYIIFEEGWLNEIAVQAPSPGCTQGFTDPSQLPAPSPTPTSEPPLACIPFQQVNGQLTTQTVDPAHEAPEYRNLLPPCDLNGVPMQYQGYAAMPDARFDRQYDVMEDANAIELELVRDRHYGPTDPSPIISPRPDRPNPGESSPTYAEWFSQWSNPSPTEQTRVTYENGFMLRSDANSCGFVTTAYALNYLGIASNVHPYQLMISAANCAETGTCTGISTDPYPNGVNLTRDGFGYWHFLNEVGNGVQVGTNAFPGDTADVDEIANVVRTSNTAIMVLVRIDSKPITQLDGFIRENTVKQNVGLLTADPLEISHWVLVTGVSSDNLWYRILNPLNNQVEYYTRDEFESSRMASDMDVIRFTNGN